MDHDEDTIARIAMSVVIDAKRKKLNHIYFALERAGIDLNGDEENLSRLDSLVDKLGTSETKLVNTDHREAVKELRDCIVSFQKSLRVVLGKANEPDNGLSFSTAKLLAATTCLGNLARELPGMAPVPPMHGGLERIDVDLCNLLSHVDAALPVGIHPGRGEGKTNHPYRLFVRDLYEIWRSRSGKKGFRVDSATGEVVGAFVQFMEDIEAVLPNEVCPPSSRARGDRIRAALGNSKSD